MKGIYRGEVMVVAGESLLNARANLVCEGDFWGGFLVMRSVAGAELVQEALHIKRMLTFNAEDPYPFVPRRTNAESPILRITGLGRVPPEVRG